MSKAPYRRRAMRTSNEITPQTVLKNCFFALLLSMLPALLLCALTALVLLKTGDPGRYHGAAGITLLYLCALLCGTLAARLSARQAPVLCGGLSGAMLLALTLAVLPFSTRSTSPVLSVGLHALLIPVCVVGALLGARQKATRRKRHVR